MTQHATRLEQRIERAARLLVAYRFGWDEAGDAARLEAERDYWRVRAREVLAAAFLELLSTPPTMWLAPADVKDAMSTRRQGIVDWLSEAAPYTTSDQKHLGAYSPEQAYWHHGYQQALKDALDLFDGLPSFLSTPTEEGK